MKKHYLSNFDETYYTDTLNNGLNVIIFHKPEYNTSVCSFGTPYGALKINQKCGNKKYNFNPGIAHFLEHKLFEAQGDDIMNAFTSLGANVNAFTSYRETVYYFSKTGSDIEEPLNLLLDFVQELNITDKSVKKEKGIINQELSMYQQIPDQRLLNEAYKCLYYNFPLKYDIGGDKKTVDAITKKELELCYSINYHPSNMVLCISSPLDPKELIKIIKNNQNKKKFKSSSKPTPNNSVEPEVVVRKKFKFDMPINADKHLMAYKIKPEFSSMKDAIKQEWALRILLESYFSSLNPDYQKWLDENIINDYFGYEVDFNMDCANMFIFIENNDSKVLPNLISETIKKDIIDEDVLEQLKRRYIGSLYSAFNDVETFNQGYIRDYLSGIDFNDSYDILNNLTLDDVKKAKQYLDCPHTCYISMLKKK